MGGGRTGMPGVGAPEGTNGRRRVRERHLAMASGPAGRRDCSNASTRAEPVYPWAAGGLGGGSSLQRVKHHCRLLWQLKTGTRKNWDLRTERALSSRSSWGETEPWAQAPEGTAWTRRGASERAWEYAWNHLWFGFFPPFKVVVCNLVAAALCHRFTCEVFLPASKTARRYGVWDFYAAEDAFH